MNLHCKKKEKEFSISLKHAETFTVLVTIHTTQQVAFFCYLNIPAFNILIVNKLSNGRDDSIFMIKKYFHNFLYNGTLQLQKCLSKMNHWTKNIQKFQKYNLC
jgi:hypothetical protein